MEDRNEFSLPENASGNPSAAQTRPLLVRDPYQGNKYDVYSLIAATLGGSTLLMCLTSNAALYCLPIVPLVLGIIALRKSHTAIDPQRTRNLAWLGIAGGGIGTLFALCMLMFLLMYCVFIFAMIAAAGTSSGYRGY